MRRLLPLAVLLAIGCEIAAPAPAPTCDALPYPPFDDTSTTSTAEPSPLGFQSLVTPRYVSSLTDWREVVHVCVDATAPALAVARVGTLAARASLPVVSAGPSCRWHLVFSDAPPSGLELAALAAWDAGAAQPERHLLVTTANGATMTTVIHALDPRGARYAVDALFELVARAPAGRGVHAALATLVDWPALPIRGVIEGFYGPPFSVPDRATLLGIMDETRQNTYVYAPQNDDCAHAAWFGRYPDDQLAAFTAAASQAAAEGVDFIWAVRPGNGSYYPSLQPISYSSDLDFSRLTDKLDQLRVAGVQHFGLFFDDTAEALTSDADEARFASFEEAQVYLVNRLDDWLVDRDPAARLLVVGSRYSAAMTDWQPYNEYLRDNLHSTIDLLWTGNETHSATITAADLEPVAASFGRAPIVWDNWPQAVTAVAGRDADLPTAAEGLLSNAVVCSWHHATVASFIEILGTAGMYAWRPDAYDAATALAAWNAVAP